MHKFSCSFHCLSLSKTVREGRAERATRRVLGVTGTPGSTRHTPHRGTGSRVSGVVVWAPSLQKVLP